MSQFNEVINISGGLFHADQVAVGQGAQAIQNIYNIASQLKAGGKEEVAQAITELLKALEANSNRISDKEEIAQTVQQVAEEAQKEKPNKLTLKGLLGGLKDSIGFVTEITEKIAVLKKAIALMMGLPTL